MGRPCKGLHFSTSLTHMVDPTCGERTMGKSGQAAPQHASLSGKRTKRKTYLPAASTLWTSLLPFRVCISRHTHT